MDQIVQYSAVQNITDITGKFAELPIIAVQNEETGEVKFTIADFRGFYNALCDVIARYPAVIVDEKNVAVYEKDAAQVKKLVDFIKDSANKYVLRFTKELTGITKGKNRYDGQVQQCEKLLMDFYDRIHSKTVEFRDSKRQEEALIKGTPRTKEKPDTLYRVLVDAKHKAEFEKYLKSKAYNYTKEE